jgi:triosephosphate isomerase (TIM)
MAHTSRGLTIAGNWKMFKTRPDAQQFVTILSEDMPIHAHVEAIICGGPTLLAILGETVSRASIPLTIAAQNMESREDGAYTGEVSPLQLKELDVNTVVLGHSERRSYYNETDATVNAKLSAALSHDMLPIVCVGETLEDREAGRTDALVAFQVYEALRDRSPECIAKTIVAYEPVWAIGTGKVCEAAEANRVCGVIRKEVAEKFGAEAGEKLRVLYGGSMKPDNAGDLLSQSDIDGGLIGGASLTPDSFRSLLQIAGQTMDALTNAAV